ncbi:MAG: ZIP family metal transporter, partial [Lentisphaeria bacterium]|nr:ZIP family metal transporter [Lentisphaeria bacterium]
MQQYLSLLAIITLAVGLSTVVGAVGGLLIRNLHHKYHDIILGTASGVMLAASILGMISPAAESEHPGALAMTAAGVFAGALIVSVLDRITPHLHRLAGVDQEQHANNRSTARTLLFITAIAIHKIPEGLAAGVSFGTGELNDVLTVAGSISLQNIPEAMVIIAPLLAVGVTMRRTILISVGIGIVSMAATLTGFALVSLFNGALPFILSLAGGTMLYVVSDEMIPETHSHGFEKESTFALIGGFMLILILQQII